MDNQEFKWDDKTVIEAILNSYGSIPTKESLKIDLDRLKASKQKLVEYEIVDYRTDGNNENVIISVRRLSDNCIFSIGDNYQQGEIKKIILSNGSIIICTYMPSGYTTCNILLSEVNKAEPKKQLILTTEDGIDIFEGDKEFDVDLKTFEINETNAIKITSNEWHNSNVAFSTKEAAEEYINTNKPCLSVKDIIDFCFIVDGGMSFGKLRELAKSKNK